MSSGLHPMDERLRERIYKNYWGFLMGICLRYVADRELAKEITNDSFMKIFANIGTFVCEDEENFNTYLKAWMRKITVRTALNHLRKKKTNIFYDEYLDRDDYTARAVVHQDSLHVNDIIKLMDRIKPAYRTIFMMYEVEGFDHDEISELVGISPSSSRVYLMRAKERLRVLYRNLMID